MLTIKYLKEILHYAPETGKWTWLVNRNNNQIKAGDEAGHTCKTHKYTIIGIRNKRYNAEKLAWFYMTGHWPRTIDHIDTNRNNNKWKNLRLATKSQNGANRNVTISNKLKIKGVNYHKASKKYIAQITANKKKHYLGVFNTPEEASLVYQKAASFYHGEFAKWRSE